MPAHAVAFDTLTYATKLEEAGFTSDQAAVQAHALADIVDERLATKEDIRDIKRDIKAFRIAAEKDIKALRIAAEKDTEQLEKRIDLKLETLRMEVKKDIEIHSQGIKKDMETLRMEVKKDIEIHSQGIKKDMEAMRLSLIIWLGGIVMVAVGALFVLLRAFPPVA